MTFMDRIRDRARAFPARIVLPEMQDPRISAAAEQMRNEGLAHPVPMADASDAHADAIVQQRGTKLSLAERLVRKPIYRAAAMVAVGEADCMIAGAATPTSEVIKAASIAIGLANDTPVPSSYFLMVFPDGREMVWSDCAMNVAPDAAELAAIARASVGTAQKLLGEARPALLSFSTGTSGQGASVGRVREAAEMAGIPGPVQADAALNAGIAARKGIEGGDANVLIFPSLDAGNIAYKIAQELAGAQAIGPFLQGFRRPVCDLSRGARADDIVAAAAVLSALSSKASRSPV